MDKKSFLHNLSNIRIVIGNGFDLHCGIHTSYYNYYQFNKDKYDHLSDWLMQSKKLFLSGMPFDIQTNKIDEVNVWDLFFVIINTRLSNDDFLIKEWSDIEKSISKSLIDPFQTGENPTSQLEMANYILKDIPIVWSLVAGIYFKIITKPDFELNIMSQFIENKQHEIKNDDEFYEFLLEELKAFEKNFGQFIKDQIVKYYYSNFGMPPMTYTYYLENVSATISELATLENVVEIDSFNYSNWFSKPLISKLNHVNGDWDNPIFGVDTIFKPNDSRFIFTKTSRRMENDSLSEKTFYRYKCKNLIVYGHSLNEADYNFFFPVFDEMLLTDNSKESVVVFAYTDYLKDGSVVKEYRSIIQKLMIRYGEYKKVNDPLRFVDGLTIQNRLMIYEVDELPPEEEDPMYKSYFKDQWDRVNRQ